MAHKSKAVVWVVECKYPRAFGPIDGWMFIYRKDAVAHAEKSAKLNGYEYRVSRYVRVDKT